MYQIIYSELDCEGNVVAHRPMQPLYLAREDAAAIAEFDAVRLSDEGHFEEASDGIYVTGTPGRIVRIEVRESLS